MFKMALNYQNTAPTVLVYYKFRGQMQPIRNLFCYLDIPFFQIFIDSVKDSTDEKPPQIRAHFNQFKLGKQNLPALIHGNTLIQGELPIITYACRCTNRNDLLGWSMQTRAKLQEILELYFSKHNKMVIQFLKLADSLDRQTHTQKVQSQRCKHLLSIIRVSGYIEPICAYLRQMQNSRYILGQISVLDFLFLQTCFIVVGSYNKSDCLCLQNNQKMKNCLSTMTSYLSYLTNEPFYIKYKQYLQNFSICSPFISQQRKQGLKKFWLGDPRFMC